MRNCLYLCCISPSHAFKTQSVTLQQTSQGLNIRITRVRPGIQDLPAPAYATAGSSGMDLQADIPAPMTIRPSESAIIPTGFSIELPPGYEGQIRPRSGLAATRGIGVMNSPGTIDADYRGELMVIIRNFGREDFLIRRGDRIAQLVIAPVVRAVWEEVAGIETTARGAGGFGHTGK